MMDPNLLNSEQRRLARLTRKKKAVGSPIVKSGSVESITPEGRPVIRSQGGSLFRGREITNTLKPGDPVQITLGSGGELVRVDQASNFRALLQSRDDFPVADFPERRRDFLLAREFLGDYNPLDPVVDTPSGTLSCGDPTGNSITIVYTVTAGVDVQINVDGIFLTALPDGDSSGEVTVTGLVRSTDYEIVLLSGATILATTICRTSSPQT